MIHNTLIVILISLIGSNLEAFNSDLLFAHSHLPNMGLMLTYWKSSRGGPISPVILRGADLTLDKSTGSNIQYPMNMMTFTLKYKGW